MKIVKKIVRRFDVIRFAVVGVINTALDFTALNVLVGIGNLPIVAANIISTTAVMVFSYKANSKLVFTDGERSHSQRKRAVLFIAGTLFGLYVLQTLCILFLTEWWTTPLATLSDVFSSSRDNTFIFTNGAKLFATVVSMTWNYLFYKRVVFKGK
jgi:putative flippase GtrA